VSGWSLAARYVPASGGVCGDWYEAELLPDGRLLVGVGDASGHGIEAAATMARVRHGARALALAGDALAGMFDHLSGVLDGDPGDSLATSIYGLVDPATGASTWASAGHPRPVLQRSGEPAALLDLPAGPPIGLPGPHRHLALPLGAGDRIVLYTDGLFERRGEDPDRGIDRLIALVAIHSDAPADELADAIMGGRGRIDDACVIVVERNAGC
jgi:serine phosphatase RsbU (regulator of sigma subunit)